MDITIRRALLLSLGEFGEKDFRWRIVRRCCRSCRKSIAPTTDPGLHAASEWLLRTWKEEAWLKQENDEWAKDKEQREKRLEGIQEVGHEGQGEDAAAVVRQRTGSDDGGNSRLCGVPNTWIAKHGDGAVGRAGGTSENNVIGGGSCVRSQ